MRQQIGLARLYRRSRDLMSQMRMDRAPPIRLPDSCALTLDALFADFPDPDALPAAFGRPDQRAFPSIGSFTFLLRFDERYHCHRGANGRDDGHVADRRPAHA
jgi:hypothetical protein